MKRLFDEYGFLMLAFVSTLIGMNIVLKILNGKGILNLIKKGILGL